MTYNQETRKKKLGDEYYLRNLDAVEQFDNGKTCVFFDREMDHLRAYQDDFPLPGFLPVMEWLEARRDQTACSRPALVHRDFHPGNVLLSRDGFAVVIDWTNVGISDTRFDLAWTLLLVQTHASPELRDLILHEYEKLAGRRAHELAIFEVHACLKRLYEVVVSLKLGPEKMGMRPEAAAMMRQEMPALERVHDLLMERTGLVVPEVEEILADSNE